MTVTLSNGSITNGSIGQFSPLSLNPLYWHDPKVESNLVKDGADVVSQHKDSSGNNNISTQGTFIQRGVWTPNAIGTNAALHLDGSNDKMEMTLGWPLQFHIFVVVRPQSTSGQRRILSSYDGVGGLGDDGQYLLQIANGTIQFQAFNLSPPIFGTPSFGINVNTDYLVEVTSTSGKAVELLVNGESIGTGTHGNLGSTAPINIGEDQPASGSDHFSGFIADNIMIPDVLGGDRPLMINYFSSNYPTIGSIS